MTRSSKRTIAAAMVVAAPAIWVGHLVVAYGLVYLTCAMSTTIPLHIVSAVALAAIGAGLALTSNRVRPQLRELATDLSIPGSNGIRFGFLAAWLLAAYFLLVIAMAEVAFLLAGPCL